MSMKLAQRFRFAAIVCLMFIADNGFAQMLSGQALVSALQDGGYVIVMRHASSPRQEPDVETANPDNVNRERQLDESGRSGAIALGESLHRLRIPITEVESSPTYRTLETARLAGFPEAEVHNELGSQGMQNSSEIYAAWLRERVSNVPQQGNLLLVTHAPNIVGAFPDLNSSPEQGEALIFDPNSSQATPVARITIGEWPDL
jgi:phosphohistidine phosphatase SixA